MSEGLALHWRLIEQRYKLVGVECKNCGRRFFPQRPLCPVCRRKGKINKIEYSGEGTVYAHTTVHVPPTGFDYQKPYVLGIIKLKEGPLIMAQIVDCRPEEVEIGKKVRMVFRKITSDGDKGVICYGYKFKLV